LVVGAHVSVSFDSTPFPRTTAHAVLCLQVHSACLSDRSKASKDPRRTEDSSSHSRTVDRSLLQRLHRFPRRSSAIRSPRPRRSSQWQETSFHSGSRSRASFGRSVFSSTSSKLVLRTRRTRRDKGGRSRNRAGRSRVEWSIRSWIHRATCNYLPLVREASSSLTPRTDVEPCRFGSHRGPVLGPFRAPAGPVTLNLLHPRQHGFESLGEQRWLTHLPRRKSPGD
jgi:hypothetical protein